MKRTIEKSLKSWKNSKNRRVLLLRGARQVGKTYSVRELGKSFEYFIEINFERDLDTHSFFTGKIDIQSICEKLSIYAETPIASRKTLVFLDEIQACPPALHALRFFYEQNPELHVIGAGSLLEFALSEIPSQGVGRLTSLFMYPLHFEEFLWAMGEPMLADYLSETIASQNAIEPAFHDKLLDLMRTHMFIGGMPAVISDYSENRNINSCMKLLEDLILFVKDDFKKYKTRIAPEKLDKTVSSIALQTGKKFNFTKAAAGSSIAGYQTALHLLVQAGLAYQIYHSSANGLPLGAQKNEKRFKVLILDTGIYQRLLQLDISKLITLSHQKLLNQGALAELYAGLQMIAGMPNHMRPELFYWHKESPASNAEIDYLFAKNEHIIPLEVKSGTQGGMKSLHAFQRNNNIQTGIRLSHENYSQTGTFDIFPLYTSYWQPFL